MKLTAGLLSLAALIPAIAATDPRFPATGPFKMMVLAYDTYQIHYNYIQVNDGFLTIAHASNKTSCGPVEGATFDGGNGNLTLYTKDGPSQQVFVDISGAADGIMSYTGPRYPTVPSTYVYANFSRVSGDTITQLENLGQKWLACKSDQYEYLVYAAANYAKADRTNCVDFEIRTDKVDEPQSCVYY